MYVKISNIKFHILKSKIKLKYFNFCKTLKSKKTVIFFLVFIQFLLLFLNLTKYIPFDYKFLLYAITFPIPLIILIILLFDTKIFKCLIVYKWFKFILFLGTSTYIILSHSYASSTINQAFGIDSSFFPITKIFLTYIYSLDILKWITLYSALGLLIFSSIIGFVIFIVAMVNKKYSNIFYFFFIVFYLSFTNSQFQNATSMIIPITQQFAINHDFNTYHKCKDLKHIKEPIMFLNNDKVLYLNKINTVIQQKYIFKFDYCKEQINH